LIAAGAAQLFGDLIRKPQFALLGYGQGNLLVVHIAVEPALVVVHDSTIAWTGSTHAFQHHLHEYRLKLFGSFSNGIGRILLGLVPQTGQSLEIRVDKCRVRCGNHGNFLVHLGLNLAESTNPGF